jgi:Na+/proline symporter
MNYLSTSACLFGFVAIGFACVAQYLGGVLQASMTIMTAISGPLAGLFFLGLMFPWANKQADTASALYYPHCRISGRVRWSVWFMCSHVLDCALSAGHQTLSVQSGAVHYRLQQ